MQVIIVSLLACWLFRSGKIWLPAGTWRDTLPSPVLNFCSATEVNKLKPDMLSPSLWKPLLFFCIIIMLKDFVILSLRLTFYLVPCIQFLCKSIQFNLTISLSKKWFQDTRLQSLTVSPPLTLHLVFPTFRWSLWRSPHKRKDAKGHQETFQDACKPHFLGPS